MGLAEVKAESKRLLVVLFVHESRSSNMEADRLAPASVLSSIRRRIWLLQPSDDLCISKNVLE